MPDTSTQAQAVGSIEPPRARAATGWSGTTLAELLLLGAIWGGSFLFMRIAAPSFGALPLVEMRLSLGALVLLPLLWPQRRLFSAGTWLRVAGLSVINSVVPFALFAWAAQRAPAGVGAITNALAVPFAAVVAYAMYGERIGLQRVVGLVLGLLGVLALAGHRIGGVSVWPAALAGTAAAALYGLGANLLKRHFSHLPPAPLAAVTLACASLLLLPFAVLSWHPQPKPALAWLGAALLGALCTGLAYAVFYRLIQRIGAPRASQVTYLIPLFAILWAWLALGEQLTGAMAAAAALILVGVWLGQARAMPSRVSASDTRAT